MMASTDKKSPLTEYHDDENSLTQVLVTSGDPSQQKARWTWGGVKLAAFTAICCCSWCALASLLAHAFAYSDHKAGDYSAAERKKRFGRNCSICGIVFGSVFIVVFGILEYMAVTQVMQLFQQQQLAAAAAQQQMMQQLASGAIMPGARVPNTS